MKTLLAIIATALICAGSGFATATVLDPRVPGLQRQIRALRVQVSGKLDTRCIEYMDVVVRPGYLYLGTDGSVFTYQAFDQFHAEYGDYNPSHLMALSADCAGG